MGMVELFGESVERSCGRVAAWESLAAGVGPTLGAAVSVMIDRLLREQNHQSAVEAHAREAGAALGLSKSLIGERALSHATAELTGAALAVLAQEEHEVNWVLVRDACC